MAPSRNLNFERQAGLMLIEVLISLIIVAIGLLGLAGLHLRAQQAETEAYQRAQALMLLNDIENRIRANRPAAWDGNYVGNVGAGAANITCTPNSTSAVDKAACDRLQFDALLKGAGESIGAANVGAMEGARGCITSVTTQDAGGATILRTYTVAVVWKGIAAISVPTGTIPTVVNSCGDKAFDPDNALRRVIYISVGVPKLS